MYTFLTGVIILAFAWMFFVFVIDAHRAERRVRNAKEAAYYELNRKQFERGTETTQLGTAKDALLQLECGYQAIKDGLDANSASCYEDDIREVRMHIEELAEEIWEENAKKILSEFIGLYDLIADPGFENIELAYRSKAKCLARYDAYWEWTRKVQADHGDCFDGLNLWDEAKEMIRLWLEDAAEDSGGRTLICDNSSNLSPRQQIEKRLDECIYAMQPEYKRKMQLRDLIIADIAKRGTIQRSKLMKANYDGFTDAEIRACYNGLRSERMIVETKQGSLYFVSLTEQGTRKIKPGTKDDAPAIESASDANEDAGRKDREDAAMIESKAKLLHDAIVQHFTDEGIEFIDKTEKRGGLYFFSEQAADDLKSKGYTVHYTENGTKGTDHRPAWYISFKE